MYRFNGILKLVFHSMVIQSLYYFKIEAFNKVVLYDKKNVNILINVILQIFIEHEVNISYKMSFFDFWRGVGLYTRSEFKSSIL